MVKRTDYPPGYDRLYGGVKAYVPPKPSTWKPKDKPTTPAIKPNSKGNRDVALCDTKRQADALRAANRILRKSGYFKTVKRDKEHVAVDPAACGSHGLRPTWTGKA